MTLLDEEPKDGAELRKDEWLIRLLRLLVAVFMFSIMAVMITDVVGRYFFNAAIKGGFEIISLLLGLLIFSALSLNTRNDDHIVVGLLDHLISGRIAWARDLFIQIVCAASLGFIADRMWTLGLLLYASGQPGKFFDIKMWPFAIAFSVLSAIACAIAVFIAWSITRQQRKPAAE